MFVDGYPDAERRLPCRCTHWLLMSVLGIRLTALRRQPEPGGARETAAAVVGVQGGGAAPRPARPSTLGRQRSGTGVVIDSSGLVLTVGYLILEATSVDLYDGRPASASPRTSSPTITKPASAWCGPRQPLGATPMPLGQQRRTWRSAIPCSCSAATAQLGWTRGQAGQPARVRRLLGVSPPRRPVHDPAARELRRRRAGRPWRAAWSASARCWWPTPPRHEVESPGNMFVPTDALEADPGRSPGSRPSRRARPSLGRRLGPGAWRAGDRAQRRRQRACRQRPACARATS